MSVPREQRLNPIPAGPQGLVSGDIAFTDDEPEAPASAGPFDLKSSDLGGAVAPLLERSGGLRDGSAFILSLEDIRASLGTRWNNLCDRLYEAIESAVEKLIEASDAFIRVGAHCYLLAFNRGGAVNSATRAVMIAQKVKEKLFGKTSALAVKVTAYSQLNEAHEPPPAARPSVQTAAAADAAPTVQSQAPIAEPARITEACEYRFVPMWDAVHKVLSTYVCMPMLMSRSGRMLAGHEILSPEASELECAEFDIRTLDYLLDVAAELHRNNFAVLIGAWINFRSLGTSKSRQALLSACTRIPQPLRNFVTCQYANVPAAVPTSTLAERIGLVRPFFRSVMMEIPSLEEPISRLNYLGLHGVFYQASTFDLNQVRKALEQAKRARLQFGFRGVTSKAVARELVDAGATYLSGPFIGNGLEMPGNMQRLSLDDLGNHVLARH